MMKNRLTRVMAGEPIFCYHFCMENFMEIMDFCGFDLEKAQKIVEEIMENAGLEKVSE